MHHHIIYPEINQFTAKFLFLPQCRRGIPIIFNEAEIVQQKNIHQYIHTNTHKRMHGNFMQKHKIRVSDLILNGCHRIYASYITPNIFGGSDVDDGIGMVCSGMAFSFNYGSHNPQQQASVAINNRKHISWTSWRSVRMWRQRCVRFFCSGIQDNIIMLKSHTHTPARSHIWKTCHAVVCAIFRKVFGKLHRTTTRIMCV